LRDRRLSPTPLRIALALLAAAALVFGAVKLLGGGTSSAPIEPVVLSEGELVDRATDLPHPAYWVGPHPASAYELTSTEDDRAYIRYLTGGAKAGDPRRAFLTVGSYAIPDAAGDLERSAAQGAGGLTREKGSTLLPGPANNAYLVFDDQPNLEIEIFAPKPGQALELARSAALRPID
jgi:hypothetical protein